MPRHHLVPQMLLRRFADEEDQLSVVQREPPHSSHLSMVRKACNEVGFYELPTADIAESHQAGHDPEQVEKTLSEIEGESAPMLDRLVRDGFPLPVEHRYRLSMLVALQASRGRRFRQDVNDVATIRAKQSLEVG